MQPLPRTQDELSPSRLRVHSGFRSRFLPSERDVTVYLPPGYGEGEYRDYPVLYMHDGQNLFGPSSPTRSDHSWRLAETADQSIKAGEIKPLIIVGVANAGERRLAEYTPTIDWELGGGEADKYGLMLIRELLPFVESTYAVSRGPANTGMAGSSLGGLVTIFLGLKYPDTFGRLAALSPAIWWNHRAILNLVNDAPQHRARPRIWLDIGESEGRRAVADADLLDRKFRARGWSPGIDLSYLRISGATHDETAWAKRVRPMLRFLFPA